MSKDRARLLLLGVLAVKHTFEIKVYYFDTDSYGIVWHGAYVKWFEMGRVDSLKLLGLELDELSRQDILFPMVNLSVRYKAPARFNDILVVETTIEEATRVTIRFKHNVFNKKDNKLLVIGTSEVVVANSEGKLLRKMPEILSEKFANVLLNSKI